MSLNTASWCTDYKITKFSHKWTINNFLCCNYPLESPTFSAPENNKLEWYYRLDPKHKSKENLLSVLLGLVVKSSDAPLQLRIQTNVYNTEGSLSFKPQVFEVYQGIRILCMDRSREGLFRGNMLIFNFEVSLIEDHTYLKPSSMTIAQPPSKLPENFTDLLEDKEFSDVKIVAGGKEFHGHKAILAVRSPVFKAMFQAEMIESKRNQVTITDIAPEIFAELLRFIYTDSVQGLDKNSLMGLLAAADKYDLAKLKAMCESALCDNIGEETVTEMLIAADLHRAEQLKRATIGFIERNTGVMDSEKWKHFWSSHFELANRTMIEMVKLKN